jgi:hypothetical protein
MDSRLRKGSSTLVTLLLSLSLTACGTLLYPERKGQVSGQIDPGVAILDGIGLFLFFVPGVVAFAVDFSNGTIYLPHGRKSKLSANELRNLHAGKLDSAELASRVAHRSVVARSVIVQPVTDVDHVTQFLATYPGNGKTRPAEI